MNQQQLLQQQAQQIAALQAQVPVPPVAPLAFALTPAMAQDGIINYKDPAGIKLHKAIIAPLATLYDGTPSKLMAFLDSIKQRASDSGWNRDLLNVSNQDPVTPVQLNLIVSHRMLTLANVRAHAITYIGQPTRLAQDSFMMYEFLRDSLTDEARIRISVEATKFEINGTRDGPCYLKVILMKFYVETNATNFFLRQSLLQLPKKMEELKSNVPAFNDHVQAITVDLAAGGQESSDLLVYLFLSYLTIEDSNFKRFIERKKEDYDDGKDTITADTLMDQALNKFNQLNQAKTWNKKSPEQEQLIALTAQLHEANTKIVELSKGKSKGSTSRDDPNTDPDKHEDPKTNGKHRREPNLESWRWQRNDDETEMEHNGKKYYWCDYHGWSSHKTPKCFVIKNKENIAKSKKDKKEQEQKERESSATNSSDNKEKAKEKHMLKLAKAFVAITEPAEDTDDEFN
jgi:hypothetical protein